jgi:uncharacterized protein (TIGR03437 family)
MFRTVLTALHCLAAVLISLGLAPPAAAQFVQQGTKLVGAGSLGYPGQGFAVALSADGNTAILGALNDNTSLFPGVSLGQGAAWIFTRSGDTWSQQGPKLVGSGPGQSSSQGYSVALSADGNTALIGGSEGIGTAGAIWFFTRSGSAWSQQGPKLVLPFVIPPPLTSAQSAFSAVALSADGNTAVAGSQGYGVRVFTRSAGVWTQQSLLVGAGITGTTTDSLFGAAVSISGDGNTIAIGGLRDASGVGATWVFARANGQWTQQGNKLVGSAAVGLAMQGLKLALSTDGNTLAVTAPADNGGFGAVWFFTRSGGVWSQQGNKMVASDVSTPWALGEAVSLSGDGNTAALAGYSTVNPSNGALWVFARTNGIWSQQGPHFSNNGGCCSTAISADSNTIIAGAPQDNAPAGSGGWGIGAASIFVRNALRFTAPPSAVAGVPLTITVSVVGPNNVVSSGYNGSVSLSSSDSLAVLPQSLALSNSVGSFVATFKTPGLHTITAKYGPSPLLTGTSTVIQVQAPGIQATPANLTFQYTQGSDPALIAPNTLTISADVPLSFTASAADSWVVLSAASGTTPTTLTVRPNPTGLAPGSYNTRITLTLADGRMYEIPVTLLVAAPVGITAFANAASFMAGPASPNTLMAAFGSFAGCTTDARVAIDGQAATVFASTPSQINFLVPAAISGRQVANVQITCAGIAFQPASLPLAPASPAIFTALQTGAGQAASINQDGGVSTPCAPGTIITLFGTGFGILADAGQDGLAHILLPVTASIGVQPATVLYAGEAPGYTRGLQQINILIPTDSPTGPSVLLRLSVGGFNTQEGVTLAIQ